MSNITLFSSMQYSKDPLDFINQILHCENSEEIMKCLRQNVITVRGGFGETLGNIHK